MLNRLLKMLDVEPEEYGQVSLLLAISFLMGVFLATFTVAAQTIFLNKFAEANDLPVALMWSGVFGIILTAIYNFLEGRIAFVTLAAINLVIITVLTAFIGFGGGLIGNLDLVVNGAIFDNLKNPYYSGFALVLPFTFITTLVFWGSFARMFNLRQSKRIIGSVDLGMTIAQIIAFFSIPVLLSYGVKIEYLFTIAVFSIIGFLFLFLRLGSKYLNRKNADSRESEEHKKLSPVGFLKNRYIVMMSLFIIVSMTALRFIDYSFFNVTANQFKNDPAGLPYFLSFFEATIVVFGFLFTTFATDRLNQDYGLRVSLIVNPLLLTLFSVAAVGLGALWGYDGAVSATAIYFFIMVSMSKLFVNSLRDALDAPTFKFYYVPIDKSIKIDTQTKIEGVVTALASTVAGALIVLINQFKIFTLLSITMFTVPLLLIWYWVTNKMYAGYRETLQGSLVKNKSTLEKELVQEFTMDGVLEKEVRSTAEEKVIYGLRLMEKLEPALFETSVLQMADSNLKRVKQFALEKIQELGIGQENRETRNLASQAAGSAEDSDLLSISPDKLTKLSKSVKQTDRMLAAKLLRKLISPKTIFILLELMRDADARVRNEALLTARKVKRPETWNVMIDLLSSPVYGYQAAAALKEAGEPALNILETAFHKSAQSDLVMLKTVQIMGHIGGPEALKLLWKKIDYPDKRIVKQILYSLRFINYHAKGREVLAVKDLLDVEMGKALWNLAALDELPDDAEEFKFLREALAEEVRENYDQITLLLSLLYDPQSVQLVRENIETGTSDGVAYGLELLDLFVDQDLKPKLVPLLDDMATKDKLEILQVYFPRENYTPIQVINYILNRDFNYNNRWSKVCAVHASAFIPDFRVSRGLISQMFNQDKFLQETAAWVIYNKDKSVYHTISQRLPQRDKKFLDSSIENNQLLDGLDDGFFLGIEMIMFIKQLPAFKGISGNLISDLADKIIPVDLKANDRMIFSADGENAPILIMAIGEIKLKYNDQLVKTLKKGAVFGDLFQDGPVLKVTEAEATERSVIFRINLPDFYFALASHHELVQGLIKNLARKTVHTQVGMN
jgi:AAA family ATP:ADP antiporter